MNLLSFDIEEWFISRQHPERIAEYDSYLDAILDKLDEHHISATFFCLGEMGVSFPNVIKRIHAKGHEIGCHSNLHLWLNKMTEEECREDTFRAMDSLEQCIGEKVKSYRAPAFSIGNNNKWVFDILAENGIEKDSSIYPAVRDFGGFPEFGHNIPCWVDYNGIRIKEFPISTINVFGKTMAYSGGGYFRFFPLRFVEKEIRKSSYAMCYFHIGDLYPEKGGVPTKEQYERYYNEPGTIKARYVRYIKTNLGKKKAFTKLLRLIDAERFVSLKHADTLIDWESAPIVKL